MKAFTECLVQIGLQFYSALIIILAGNAGVLFLTEADPNTAGVLAASAVFLGAVLLCSWSEFRMTVLFMRQQTKRWFSNVQLPEPFFHLAFRHPIPIPASFCLLAEQ